MKIVIFGATGRTGIPLVQQALQAGHEVVGFVRTPSKMPIHHEKLHLVQGDVMNANDIARAITPDVQAVISVLSPVKGSPDDMLPTAIGHILPLMQQHAIKRLVYMTGAGVSAPEDKPQPINHLIKFALKTISPKVLAQSEQAVNLVRQSNRDWVIVRAPMLTDGPYTGQLREGWVGVNTGPRLARADAAAFILRQVTENTYLHQAPVISN